MTHRIRKVIAGGLCGVWIILALTGCASLEQQVSEHPGTAIGAVAGAAGGAILGGLIFKSTTGAVIGGLLGGLAGGAIGSATEAQKQDQASTNRDYGYRANQGTLVRIEEVSVTPSQVRPGGTLNLAVQYALLTPRPDQEVTVAERWNISYKGQTTGSPVHTVRHPGGTWAGSLPITLPNNARTGTYRVAVTVEAEGKSDTMDATFTVRR